MTTSLYEKVRAALGREKKHLATQFERGYRSKATTDQEEIVGMNKFFRLELAAAPVTTRDERECLVDDLAPGMWLKYFESHVLPTLVRFDLPRG